MSLIEAKELDTENAAIDVMERNQEISERGGKGKLHQIKEMSRGLSQTCLFNIFW